MNLSSHHWYSRNTCLSQATRFIHTSETTFCEWWRRNACACPSQYLAKQDEEGCVFILSCLFLFLCHLREQAGRLSGMDFPKWNRQFGRFRWRDSNAAHLYCSASTIEWTEPKWKGHWCDVYVVAYLRDLLAESWVYCYQHTVCEDRREGSWIPRVDMT